MQKADFFSNIGGLNVTDSLFYVQDNQATGGFNYEYAKTGAISKVRGKIKLNNSADAQLRTKALLEHLAKSGTKTIVRAAGTKVQTVDLDTGVFTNQTEDTTAVNSDFFNSTSTQQVTGVNFNTASADTMWLAGGGASKIYGFTGTKVTENGVPAPTGTFTVSVGGSGGSWPATGTYYYALVLRKAITQALSNAALDKVAVISSVMQKATLTFPTGVDATKYDQWYVYRSAVGGVEGFTTGNLIAQVTVGTATYIDDGGTIIADAQVVPREGLVELDNSQLPAGTYKYVAAYKSRLLAAKDATLYVSDLFKPESWPIDLNVTLPYGGNITGIKVVGFNAPITGNTDEYVVIFQEKYCWLITGDFAFDENLNIYNFELKFLDSVGCTNQSLVVGTNGFICWVDYRGIYLFNGSGKPIYVSRPLEGMFNPEGDIDLTKLTLGFGVYLRQKSQILWTLSSKVKGENKIRIRLDLRLTVPNLKGGLEGTVADGAFTEDFDTSLYGSMLAFLQSNNQELLLSGDDAGYVYKMFFSTANDGNAIEFTYETKAFDFGSPGMAKRYHKVIAYIEESVAKDLVLDYWADYRLLEKDKSTVSATMDFGEGTSASLWDLALWDEALWDEFQPKTRPIVFNLHSQQNNNEGDSLKLRFKQLDKDAPVVIHGFSVLYEDIAIRK